MRRYILIVVLGLAVSPAAALDLPARKPGLWDLKMIFEGQGMPPMSMQQCIDADTDKLMNANFGNMTSEACSKQEMKKLGATIVVDSVCKVGPATMTTRAVMSGDFNSAYTVKVAVKRTGGAATPGVPDQTNMSIEAKWSGACKAGQKPGDMIMPGGVRVNVRDLPRGMPGR